MTQTNGRNEMSPFKEKRTKASKPLSIFTLGQPCGCKSTFSGKCYQRKYLEHICWRAGGGGTTFAEQTEIYKHLNLGKIGVLKIAPIVRKTVPSFHVFSTAGALVVITV